MNSRARLIKAIDNSACLTRRQINDYIYKKLFPEELYVVEMHLNECPFCNDAIEGFLKTDNANQLLSEVDTLQLPAIDATPEPVVEKVIPKKETQTPPAVKPEHNADKPVHPTQRKTLPFEAEERKRGVGWKVGLAAAAVIGLGVWGLNRFNDHKAEKAAMLAQAADSAGILSEDGTPAVVSRQEDSAMNAKFGMQGQTAAPVVASSSTTRDQLAAADSSSIVMAEAADVAPATAAAPAAAMSREVVAAPTVAAKTAAPVDAKAKSAAPALAKTSTTESKVKAAEAAKEPAANTRTASSSTASKPVATAVKTAATEKTVAKEKVRPSAKTPEERAKDAAVKKAAADEKAALQAEADFKKGMELYKKKQYTAALPYFQTVAKKPGVPNSKQAAKYVKLCKEQIEKAKTTDKD